MAQFYFLSVLLNVIAGLILVYGKNLFVKKETSVVIVEESKESETVGSENAAPENKETEIEISFESEPETKEKKPEFLKGITAFDSKNFRLVTGVLCAFVGIMKILSVFRNDVPVVGDLIPALAGIAAAASLLIEYYSYTSSDVSEMPAALEKIFITSRKYIGILCLLAGLLHFIFPQVILL